LALPINPSSGRNPLSDSKGDQSELPDIDQGLSLPDIPISQNGPIRLPEEQPLTNTLPKSPDVQMNQQLDSSSRNNNGNKPLGKPLNYKKSISQSSNSFFDDDDDSIPFNKVSQDEVHIQENAIEKIQEHSLPDSPILDLPTPVTFNASDEYNDSDDYKEFVLVSEDDPYSTDSLPQIDENSMNGEPLELPDDNIETSPENNDFDIEQYINMIPEVEEVSSNDDDSNGESTDDDLAAILDKLNLDNDSFDSDEDNSLSDDKDSDNEDDSDEEEIDKELAEILAQLNVDSNDEDDSNWDFDEEEDSDDEETSSEPRKMSISTEFEDDEFDKYISGLTEENKTPSARLQEEKYSALDEDDEDFEDELERELFSGQKDDEEIPEDMQEFPSLTKKDLEPADVNSQMSFLDKIKAELKGEDPDAKGRAPKKSVRSKPKVNNSNSRKNPFAFITNIYMFFVNIFFNLLMFILKILSSIPIIGMIFKPILSATEILKKIANFFPLLFTVGVLFAINYYIVPQKSTIELPDNGSGVIQNLSYDSNTNLVKGTIVNTGDVILEVTPTVTVYSLNPQLTSPLTWILSRESQTCVGETVSIDIDTEQQISIQCSDNTDGFWKRSAGVLE